MFLERFQPSAPPFIIDREAALEASRLIADHGPLAAEVATANADLSRDRGNVVSFCRWRQIARLIAFLSETDGEQTRH